MRIRIYSIIRGNGESEAEGAQRPTAGSETREFTSRVERGRVPRMVLSSTVSLLSQRLDEHKERMIMKAKRKIFLDCASNADPCALVVN